MSGQKEIFEFTFSCENCGETVKTRSDDGKSVKDCPHCHGRMLYGGMRTLEPEEISSKIVDPENIGSATRTVPY